MAVSIEFVGNMAVSIPIDSDEDSWPWNNEKLKRLKARRYPDQYQKVENMEPALYEATKKGDVDDFINALQQRSDAKKLNLNTILNQVSPSGNSLLHVAASHGSKEITELMASHFPFLITKQNLHGDTPLHIAVNTTETLVNFAKEFGGMSNDVSSLLRIKNEKGNTALHEAVAVAVKNCNHQQEAVAVAVKDCNHQQVQFLVMADPEVAYYQNNKGKSPLYLAVKNKDIFNIVLKAIEADNDSLYKLQGKSPMHAAVEQRNLEIVIKKRELMHYKDEKGGTPLHCAASIGFLDGVHFLLNILSDAALERDKKGRYPIHVACKNGHINVTNELLRMWPDPVEMLSNKGQNILHFATKSGRVDLMIFLIKTQELESKLDELLYKKDQDGNTPLHLATIRGHYFVVWSLARRERHCLKLKNKEGLTAYDVADKQSTGDTKGHKHYIRAKDKQIVNIEHLIPGAVAAEKKSTMEESKNYKEPDYFDTMMTLSVLNALELITYGFGFFRKYQMTVTTIKSTRPSQEEINNRINTLMVVAALVAGATFAAATNMPGGGSSSGGVGGSNCGQNQGTPIWINNMLVPLFALLNAGALKFSLFTAIIILWAQLGDISLASIAVWIASGVLSVSLYMMCLAFFVAVIIGVVKYHTMFYVILILELLLGILFTIFSIPIIIPIKYKRAFMLCISFIIFCVRYVQKRMLAKLIKCQKEGQ